jgi:hypothetical protein
MNIAFSFDSEDYLTRDAADADKWWAEELSLRGLRATFQCVGEWVRALRRWEREDVIRAVGRHDIGIHTDFHSRPPTHPQALEGLGLAEGIEYVIRAEAPAFATLEAEFGRVPVSYCSPGDSWTPATLLAMACRGVKIFCNDILPVKSSAPFYYCGLLTLSYGPCFEDYFADNDGEERFRKDVLAAQERIGEDDVLILYSHPCRLMTLDFWDSVFYGANARPLADCPPAPLRSQSEIQTAKDRCLRMLDWLQTLPDVRFTDIADIYSGWNGNRRTLDALLDECGLKPGREGDLPLLPNCAGYLDPAIFDQFRYTWPLYPSGFTGQQLINQARGLTWTSS